MSSIALLIIELWLFAGIALLLHAAQLHVGLTPLLFYVAAITVILNFAELLVFHIEIAEGIVLRTGGHVFVPVILAVVLILYVANGTQPAQLVLYGLSSVNVLVLVALFFLVLYANVHDPSTTLAGFLAEHDNLITLEFVRGVGASVLTFAADMLVIAIFYQGIRNVFRAVPDWITIGVALIGALWTDAVLYNLLYFVGTPHFTALLPGDVLAKTLAGLAIWPPVAYYLIRVAPHAPSFVGAAGRPTFDMLFGTFGQLSHTLDELRAELYESRATYRELTEHIQSVFWLVDLNRNEIYYLSPAFERLTGRKSLDFYRRPFEAIQELVHPDDTEQFPTPLKELASSPSSESEFRIIRPNGDIRWARMQIFPIRNVQGQVIRAAGLIEDVTELRLAHEHALTAAMERGRLESLREFIRDVSHDLKTPLTSLRIKAHLAQKMPDPAQRTRHLDELCLQVDQMARLIDSLLTVTKLDDLASFIFTPVNLTPLLEDTYQMMSPLAEAKGLHLMFEPPSTPLVVIGDAQELSRAVNNLVANALRYTDRGSVRLRAGQQGDEAVIEVSDTGVGISEDDLHRIFELYYRAKETGAQHEGTGLGLVIARKIVEAHRGVIEVQSELGRGSTFTIRLPLRGMTPLPDEPRGASQESAVRA